MQLAHPRQAADNHTLEWLRDRVREGHHKALAKYLIWRTPDLVARDDAANLSVNQILVTAFKVKNDVEAFKRLGSERPEYDARGKKIKAYGLLMKAGLSASEAVHAFLKLVMAAKA